MFGGGCVIGIHVNGLFFNLCGCIFLIDRFVVCYLVNLEVILPGYSVVFSHDFVE